MIASSAGVGGSGLLAVSHSVVVGTGWSWTADFDWADVSNS